MWGHYMLLKNYLISMLWISSIMAALAISKYCLITYANATNPDSTFIVPPRQPTDFASQQGSCITTSGELCNALHHSHWLGMYSSNKTGVTITPQRKTSNLTEQFSASPSPTSDFASMQDSHIGRTAAGLCIDLHYSQ